MSSRTAERECVLLVSRRRDALEPAALLLRHKYDVSGPLLPDDPRGLPPVIDCAVVDLSDRDRSAQRAFVWLCRRNTAVIAITAAWDSATRIEAVRLGAADHAVSPFDTAEVVVRVDAQLAQRRSLRSDKFVDDDLVVRLDDRRVIRAGEDVSLTPREFDVLVVLMRAHGRAVSKLELLQEVWGDTDRNVNAVEAHVSALRRKLECDGAPLIHTVHRSGYAFRPRRTASS